MSTAAFGITVVAMASGSALAQSGEEPLVTDRPDFTESAETIPEGRVQLEGGVTFERSADERSQSWGEGLVRISTGARSELRVGIPSYVRVLSQGRTFSGLDDAYLGAKFVLREGAGTRPQVALLVGSTLPTGSRRVAERGWQPEAVAAASIDISESTSIGVNLGYAYARIDGERFSQLFGSVAVGHSLNERWGVFAEVFGFNRTEAGGTSEKYLSGGLTYLVNPNFQLDARVGTELGNGRGRFYGVGASRRF